MEEVLLVPGAGTVLDKIHETQYHQRQKLPRGFLIGPSTTLDSCSEYGSKNGRMSDYRAWTAHLLTCHAFLTTKGTCHNPCENCAPRPVEGGAARSEIPRTPEQQQGAAILLALRSRATHV